MDRTFGRTHRMNIATAYLKNPGIFHPETAGAIETWSEYEEAKKTKRRPQDQTDAPPSMDNTRTKARAKAKRILSHGSI